MAEVNDSFKPLKVHFANYKMLNGRTQRRIQRVDGGAIVKRFELTPYPTDPSDVVCPHFLELKWGYGCPYDCAWCFLKGTLRLLPEKTAPKTKPRDIVEKHVRSALIHQRKSELFNTGELCDSLMDERGAEPFSKWISDIFQEQESHKVLFLTKSGSVANLLDMDPHSQTVVSFSMNAEKVSRRWEKAPSVLSRIKAAAALSEAGWEVRVRIDPVVPIPDWEEQYRQLSELLFGNFTPDRVTLGTLRGLQSTLNNVRDDSWTVYLDGERSGWGKKTRADIRESLYRHMLSVLEHHISMRDIGICKETMSMFDALGIDFRKQVCNCML